MNVNVQHTHDRYHSDEDDGQHFLLMIYPVIIIFDFGVCVYV